MFAQTIGAATQVVIALCGAGVEYAEAARSSGKVLNRVITVADKHVEVWEYEQDQIILDRKAEIEMKRAAMKLAREQANA